MSTTEDLSHPSDDALRVELPTATSPTQIDGEPVRDPLVLTEQKGAVVVWQVDLLGHPVGGWEMRYEGTETAHTLLSLCDRRGLIAMSHTPLLTVLGEWADACGAKISVETLEARLCSIPLLLRESTAARSMYSEAVRELNQEHGKNRAALQWKRGIPDPVPETIDQLATSSGLHGPWEASCSPGIGHALLLAGLTRWAIGLWIDTQSALRRRPYLREIFGPAQPVPPSWRAALSVAYRSPFDLRLPGTGRPIGDRQLE